MRFCPDCGARLAGDSPRFCSECGGNLGHASPIFEPEQSTGTDAAAAGLSVDFDGLRAVAAMADPVRTWEVALRGDIADLALEWFEPPCYRASDAFQRISPEDGVAIREQGSWMAHAEIGLAFALAPNAAAAPADWNPGRDQVIGLSETASSKRIERACQEIGYPTHTWGQLFVSVMATPAGGSVIHMGEIRVSDGGREYLYWYTTPVVSLGELPENSVTIIGLVAAIPALLQSLAYVAECPTPTEALFRRGLFTRAEAFGLTPNSYAPRRRSRLWAGQDPEPFYVCTDPRAGLIQAFWTRARIDHGVAIPLDVDNQALANCLLTTIESANKLTAIIESGFLNYPDGEIGFQRALMAQAAWTVFDHQAWIPPSLPSQVTGNFPLCQ